MGPVSLGGNCERRKVPSPWEPPSLVGRSTGTDRELQRLRKTPTEMVLFTSLHFPSSSGIPAGVYSEWVLKLGLQQIDTGRGLGLAVQGQTEGPEVWPGPQLGVCKRQRQVCHRSPIVKTTREMHESAIAASLSAHSAGHCSGLPWVLRTLWACIHRGGAET